MRRIDRVCEAFYDFAAALAIVHHLFDPLGRTGFEQKRVDAIGRSPVARPRKRRKRRRDTAVDICPGRRRHARGKGRRVQFVVRGQDEGLIEHAQLIAPKIAGESRTDRRREAGSGERCHHGGLRIRPLATQRQDRCRATQKKSDPSQNSLGMPAEAPGIMGGEQRRNQAERWQRTDSRRQHLQQSLEIEAQTRRLPALGRRTLAPIARPQTLGDPLERAPLAGELDRRPATVDRPLLDRDQGDRAVHHRLALAKCCCGDRTVARSCIPAGAQPLEVTPAISPRPALPARDALNQSAARVRVDGGQLDAQHGGRRSRTQELALGIARKVAGDIRPIAGESAGEGWGGRVGFGHGNLLSGCGWGEIGFRQSRSARGFATRAASSMKSGTNALNDFIVD